MRNIIGNKYGYLLVIKKDNSKNRSYWFCECHCGQIKSIRESHLIDGSITSCKCMMNKGAPTHGESQKTKEYMTWQLMKRRCYNKNDKSYSLYGGRGITVCDRWKNSFENFLSDIGRAPSQGHSIDRIDFNKGYEPFNCRWATKYEQANNTRANIFLTIGNEKKTVAQWCRKFNINSDACYARIKRGKSIKEALGLEL